MNFEGVERLIGDLDAEQWRPLLIENVPTVQAAVHPCRKKDRGTCRGPAAICKVLSVGAEKERENRRKFVSGLQN